MNITLKLTKSSLKMFARNRQALFFSLFMPLVLMSVFGLIGSGDNLKISVGLVQGLPTQSTQQFIDQIKAVPFFEIHEGSINEELAALDNGDRAVVLNVPDAFIPDVPTSEKRTIQAYTNVGQAQQAEAVISGLQQLLNDANLAAAHAQPIFGIESQTVDANNLKTIDFLLPGLVALSLMQLSIFSVANVFTDYREKGILKRIMATPMRPYQFIMANVITRLIISVIQAAVLVFIGVHVFNAVVVGSYSLVGLEVILGAVMFLGLGFTISGLAKTRDSVPALSNLVVFPMMFFGGVFFPITAMPGWLKIIASFLPISYLSDALRQVMTEGAGFAAIRWDFVGMAVWAVILVGLATLTFSFENRKG
ncbi:MAG TPA: ABC transporter permease [Candidatus Paceibacterota bacterium]|nr:ABC transporter permease [Candidatus Paceibacterota bacterium]